MALEGQQRVVVIHAAAVVDHADQALAARFRFNANRTRAGVQSVFKQFFHHGGGPLDHFSCRNFIGDGFRKYADTAHGVWLAEGGPVNPGSSEACRNSSRASSSVFLSS